VNIGWQPIMTMQAFLAIVLWLMAFYRARVPYQIRAGFLVVLFVVIALGGIWTFGIGAGGVGFLVVLPILTTVFFGIRSSLTVFAGAILVASLIGALFILGYRSPAFDLAAFPMSAPVWATAILSWTLAGGTTAIAINALHEFLFESLKTTR